MAISIIMPAFDASEFIGDCIDSMKEQSYTNFDVHIGIDNCDKTLRTLKKMDLDSRFKLYQAVENVGPYVIANTLLEKCRCPKHIKFDADDVMRPNMVNRMMKILAGHSELVYCRYENFGLKEPNKNVEAYAEGVYAAENSVMDSLGGFRAWRCAADTDFRARATNAGVRITRIPEVLFDRRVHTKNLTRAAETALGSPLRQTYKAKIATAIAKGHTKVGIKKVDMVLV